MNEALSKKLEDINIIGPLDEDPEYQLIVASNSMTAQIQDEVQRVHRYTADIYAKKFPELASMVPTPLDYARVVKIIGNEMVC